MPKKKTVSQKNKTLDDLQIERLEKLIAFAKNLIDGLEFELRILLRTKELCEKVNEEKKKEEDSNREQLEKFAKWLKDGQLPDEYIKHNEPYRSPYPYPYWPTLPNKFDFKSKCSKCGLVLSDVMSYSCIESNCPSGLGPVMCSVAMQERIMPYTGISDTTVFKYNYYGKDGDDTKDNSPKL